MAIEVIRTYVGAIQNHQQVRDGLDSLGDSVSKIWNVASWTADRIWNATGEIPDEGVLKAYMKNQSCWRDLNAQSSQKVIEELSEVIDPDALDSLFEPADESSSLDGQVAFEYDGYTVAVASDGTVTLADEDEMPSSLSE